MRLLTSYFSAATADHAANASSAIIEPLIILNMIAPSTPIYPKGTPHSVKAAPPLSAKARVNLALGEILLPEAW